MQPLNCHIETTVKTCLRKGSDVEGALYYAEKSLKSSHRHEEHMSAVTKEFRPMPEKIRRRNRYKHKCTYVGTEGH